MGKTSSAVKNRYRSKAYDQIVFTVQKGTRATLQAFATSQGETLSGLIKRLLWAEMAAQGYSLPNTALSEEPER